ncbi:MAG TPA: NlpC/P60 family protein [Bacteroidia bacterium]|nr:NlpC/P60 family protein [Bacteroidia bacterium]
MGAKDSTKSSEKQINAARQDALIPGVITINGPGDLNNVGPIIRSSLDKLRVESQKKLYEFMSQGGFIPTVSSTIPVASGIDNYPNPFFTGGDNSTTNEYPLNNFGTPFGSNLQQIGTKTQTAKKDDGKKTVNKDKGSAAVVNSSSGSKIYKSADGKDMVLPHVAKVEYFGVTKIQTKNKVDVSVDADAVKFFTIGTKRYVAVFDDDGKFTGYFWTDDITGKEDEKYNPDATGANAVLNKAETLMYTPYEFGGKNPSESVIGLLSDPAGLDDWKKNLEPNLQQISDSHPSHYKKSKAYKAELAEFKKEMEENKKRLEELEKAKGGQAEAKGNKKKSKKEDVYCTDEELNEIYKNTVKAINDKWKDKYKSDLGIDCSGFAYACYQKDNDLLLNIKTLYAGADGQEKAFVKAMDDNKAAVFTDFKNLSKGDMVFFYSKKDKTYDHVVIATGRIKTDKDGNVTQFETAEANETKTGTMHKWRDIDKTEKTFDLTIGHPFRSTDKMPPAPKDGKALTQEEINTQRVTLNKVKKVVSNTEVAAKAVTKAAKKPATKPVVKPTKKDDKKK